MKIKDFKIREYEHSRPVLVYGAGVIGEYVLEALKAQDIQVRWLCDKYKSGYVYKDIPIVSLAEADLSLKPYILIAVGARFNEIVEEFGKIKPDEIYTVHELAFESDIDLTKLSQNAQDREYYKNVYRWGINTYKAPSQLHIRSLDWQITQKCSLRCRNCANLIPYYQDPINYKLEEIKEFLNIFIDAVDDILDIRVNGGEPFMNPELADYIAYAIQFEKIYNVTVYTNATILPNEKILTVLKNKKVRLEITNYGELAPNYNAFIDLMKINNIRYNTLFYPEWHDTGKLEDRNNSIEEKRKKFYACGCSDLMTLMNNKLYICPYSANGRCLTAIPEMEEDVIEMISDNIAELKSKIKWFIAEKDYDNACGYCSSRDFHVATVPPAIQCTEKLSF